MSDIVRLHYLTDLVDLLGRWVFACKSSIYAGAKGVCLIIFARPCIRVCQNIVALDTGVHFAGTLEARNHTLSIAEFFLGSVSSKISQYSNVPVLIVK